MNQGIIAFAQGLTFFVIVRFFQNKLHSFPLSLFAHTSSEWLQFSISFGTCIHFLLWCSWLIFIHRLGCLKFLLEILKSWRNLLLFFRQIRLFDIYFRLFKVSFGLLFELHEILLVYENGVRSFSSLTRLLGVDDLRVGCGGLSLGSLTEILLLDLDIFIF